MKKQRRKQPLDDEDVHSTFTIDDELLTEKKDDLYGILGHIRPARRKDLSALDRDDGNEAA